MASSRVRSTLSFPSTICTLPSIAFANFGGGTARRFARPLIVTSTTTGPPFCCSGVEQLIVTSPTAATGGPGGIGRAKIVIGGERRWTSTTLPSNMPNGSAPPRTRRMIAPLIASGGMSRVPLRSGKSATRRMGTRCTTVPPRLTCRGCSLRTSSSSDQKSPSFGRSASENCSTLAPL